MAFTTKLNLIDAKFYQCAAGTLALSGSTSIGEAQYLTDKSATYTARSVPDAAYVTGQTADLQSQIDYVSGVTDTNTADIATNASAINLVSGATDTNTADIATNASAINLVSGATDTNTANIATNTSAITFISGVTDTNTADIATNASAINLISGATDTNTADIATNASAINLVSGATDTNASAITLISGVTDQNTNDISNLGAISGLTEAAITGVTNGLTKVGSNDACLGGTMSAPVTITTGSNLFKLCGGNGNYFQQNINTLSWQVSGATGCAYSTASGTGVYSLSSSNGSNLAYLTISPSCSSLFFDSASLQICANCATFSDGNNSQGLVYGGDYESNFVARSLVTKQYVDSASGGIGGANGLSRDGDNIVLGGTLSGNTDINLSTFDLKFSGDSVQYTADYSSTYVARSLVDAAYLTGITSTKLAISDFNSYSATTDSRLDGIDDDIALNTAGLATVSAATDLNTAGLATVSAATDQNTSDISNLGAISGITEAAITGVTNGLTDVGSNCAKLGGLLTENTTVTATGGTCFEVKGVGSAGSDGFYFDSANATVASKMTSDFTCYATVYLTHTCANLYSHDDNGGTCSCVGLGNNGNISVVLSNTLTIDSENSCPAQYAADYSAGFTARSIPDAAWVTGQTGAIGAANGLTRSGDNIIQNLTSRMELTKNQETEVSPILKEHFRNKQLIRQKYGDRGGVDRRFVREEIQTLRRNTEESLRNVLSEEQMNLFQKLMEERTGRIRDRINRR